MIVLAVIVSFRFPVVVPVPKTIVPEAVPVVAPLIVQFRTVSPEASAMKRMVAAVAPVLVLSIVSAFPPLFRPSMTTLPAPFRSIRTPAMPPEIVRAAPPAGAIVTPVYDAPPAPLAFRTALAPSVVSPQTSIVIVPV